MREWLTAAEIAAAALPGLPETKSAVLRYAERAGWGDSLAYVRTRAGRGGGCEYHVALLPPLARIEYERRHRAIPAEAPASAPMPPPNPPPQGTPPRLRGGDPAAGEGDARASDRAAAQRDARLAVLAALDDVGRGQRLAAAAQVQLFVDGYNAGRVAVEPWVRAAVPHLSRRTLQRWQAARRAGRADALAVDRAAARKGTGVLDRAAGGRVRTFLLAAIAHNPHLSAEHLRALIRAEFGDRLDLGDGRTVEVPPVRTIQHVVARLRQTERVALTKLTNPDRYRSIYAPSGVGSYRWVTEPNTLWMIDASKVDALCVDGRHNIYACIDIATRRTILYFSKTPRASAVACLIRKAILAWGVPDAVKTDNGSDFTARDTQRLFTALGIEMELSDPYQPQQKGHVERVIKTFQHDFAVLLPGYIGHSVADRKAIEARKSFADRRGEDDLFDATLTGAELQVLADRWIEAEYSQRVHSALGVSPAQKAATSTRPIRTVDPRALDLLLMPVADGDGCREVTKFGVRVANHHYVVMEALPGDRVLVRLDPSDAGRIYAFCADDGRFVGEGICPELAGVDPAAVLRERRRMQAEIVAARMQEASREAKALAKGPALIERVLDVAARDMGAKAAESANVLHLPPRTETHETPAIAAALDAVAPRPVQTPTPSADVLAMQARLLAEQDVVVPLRSHETDHQRWRRALALIARIKAGEPVDPEEAMWLGGYREGAEFKGRALTWGDPFETTETTDTGPHERPSTAVFDG